jgi:preprotein translocase SecE subunit
MFERFKHFLLESKKELHRVNWPTREETMRLTGVVIALSVAVAAFLGAFDFIFLEGVKAIVGTDGAPAAEAPAEEGTPDFGLTPQDVEFEGDGDLEIKTVEPTE